MQLFSPLHKHYVIYTPLPRITVLIKIPNMSKMFYLHLANSGMTIFLIYYGTGCRNYGFLASGGRILCVLCTISREESPRICCNWHLYFRGKPAKLHVHCISLSFKRVDVIAIIFTCLNSARHSLFSSFISGALA